MNRKNFIAFLTVAAASGTLASYLSSCSKSNSAPAAPSADFTLDLTSSTNSALLSSGGYVITNQIVVINNSGSYVALSDICTHQGCALGYNSSAKQLTCSCHGGVFDLSGAVIAGPPPSSLKVYTVVKNGNSLHITG